MGRVKRPDSFERRFRASAPTCDQGLSDRPAGQHGVEQAGASISFHQLIAERSFLSAQSEQFSKLV
jgi:hypothetical protein